MRYFLNAIIAKRAGAGGFQISCNYARACLNDKNTDWFLIVSTDVGDFIKDEFDKELFDKRVRVFPSQPDRHSYFRVRKQVKSLIKEFKPDVVYSILAPSYFSFDCPEVMRCCNAWDLIPLSHVVFKIVDKKLAFRMQLKAQFIIHLMRKTTYFMTQTEEAKKGICRVTKTSGDNVCVVPNVLNRTFANAPKDSIDHEGFNILFVGAPAIHKNIMILPEVAHILKEKYGCKDLIFTTTFDKNALHGSGLEEKFNEYDVAEMWNNLGRKSQTELIDVYRSSDMGFFPSLLETFSATLLEYMCFGLPTVISDMSFNTEVMGGAALAYSPLSAEDAAEQIYKVYSDKKLQEDLRQKGYKQLEKYSSFDKYYTDTLNFLTEVANKENENQKPIKLLEK